MDFQQKKMLLHKNMEELAKRDILVAFSGGVDSSLLLKVAAEHAGNHGSRVIALTADTELHSRADGEAAKKTAREIGAEHHILKLHELSEADIIDNPTDRCYRCKKYIFKSMMEAGEKMGISVIVEGSNLEDTYSYRPGLRAIEELGISSPLKDALFTKQDVRMLAAEYGLTAASRPSAPCLATRFPYHTRLSEEAMERAEKGEEFLRECDFHNVRIRVYGDLARIEVDEQSFSEVLERKKEIIARMHELGYQYVTLDLEGFRSGSMDAGINQEGIK